MIIAAYSFSQTWASHKKQPGAERIFEQRSMESKIEVENIGKFGGPL